MRFIKKAVTALIFTVLCTVSLAQTPVGCPGKRNESPVLDLPAQPLKTVENGQSWKMQQGDSVVYVNKLKGTAYEMGKAFG
jgi:hypothetical protein